MGYSNILNMCSITLFNFFINGTDISKKALINDAESKLKAQQSKLDKIHRTRIDKNWKQKR